VGLLNAAERRSEPPYRRVGVTASMINRRVIFPNKEKERDTTKSENCAVHRITGSVSVDTERGGEVWGVQRNLRGKLEMAQRRQKVGGMPTK